MDVKDPTASFVKSMPVIAGTLDKLQIPIITFRECCICGRAATSANDSRSFVLDDDDDHDDEEDYEEGDIS